MALSLEERRFAADHERDHWDHHIKTANYLLVAHGAALIACLSALKDYNVTPKLHGVGIFIFLSCLGLITAAISHGFMSYARVMSVQSDTYPEKSKLVDDVTIPLLIGLLISFLCFSAILITLSFKFWSL